MFKGAGFEQRQRSSTKEVLKTHSGTFVLIRGVIWSDFWELYGACGSFSQLKLDLFMPSSLDLSVGSGLKMEAKRSPKSLVL